MDIIHRYMCALGYVFGTGVSATAYRLIHRRASNSEEFIREL